jgi:hypothetical protein
MNLEDLRRIEFFSYDEAVTLRAIRPFPSGLHIDDTVFSLRPQIEDHKLSLLANQVQRPNA